MKDQAGHVYKKTGFESKINVDTFKQEIDQDIEK